jgi:ABC-type phosphate transport system substrate-binding protein
MFSLTPCFAHHMAVIVNKENKVQNVTSAHLAKIFKRGSEEVARRQKCCAGVP